MMGLRKSCMFLLALALMAAASAVPPGKAAASGTLLQTGNYYYGVAPNGGGSPDKGATELVPSADGILLDGLATTYAGWMGSDSSQGTVQVVFDLLKDYPLESIDVVLNAPNMYWGYKSSR